MTPLFKEIFVKHFNSFKVDLFQSIEGCMACLAELQGLITQLEKENEYLKESLEQLKTKNLRKQNQ